VRAAPKESGITNEKNGTTNKNLKKRQKNAFVTKDVPKSEGETRYNEEKFKTRDN
jgi:hypothetical protein